MFKDFHSEVFSVTSFHKSPVKSDSLVTSSDIRYIEVGLTKDEMIKQVNHPVQLAILRRLLFMPSERFAELQSRTDLTSDHFTFHINKLVDVGLVQRQSAGTYALTVTGKEHANRLEKGGQSFGKQPKLSVLLDVERYKNGRREFLVQQRLKHPHYGFYGRISGKSKWGEGLMETAQRVLYEEAGLTAEFNYRALLRKFDYEEKTSALLEDKLFAIMQASEIQGKLKEKWPGGQNVWMTQDEFMQLDPSMCFKSARNFMASPDDSVSYFEEADEYRDDQY